MGSVTNWSKALPEADSHPQLQPCAAMLAYGLSVATPLGLPREDFIFSVKFSNF